MRKVNFFEGQQRASKRASNNGPKEVPPDREEDSQEDEPKPWDECLRLGMCTSEALYSLDIVPPRAMLGDWMRE
jgi:hypothetical protein